MYYYYFFGRAGGGGSFVLLLIDKLKKFKPKIKLNHNIYNSLRLNVLSFIQKGPVFHKKLSTSG